MCEISSKTECSYRSKYWAEGVVYCTCGTCLMPTEHTRRLTKEKFDTLSIPYFVIENGSWHGARYWKTDAQREYHQTTTCSRKALRLKFNSILERFQQHDTYSESQLAIGWTEDTCRHVDQIANLVLHCHMEREATVGSLFSTRKALMQRRLLRSCQANQRFGPEI